MKICKVCKVEKELNDFRKYRRSCKKCEYLCNKETMIKYHIENKDRIDNWQKEYQEKNIDTLKEYRKEYYGRDDIKSKNKPVKSKYYQDNKEELLIKSNERNRNRRKNDPLYKLYQDIKGSIGLSIRNKGYTKKSRTHEILGCSYVEFQKHLESKFETWMNWGNKGKYNGSFNYGWDMDHIIPLSSATTEQELLNLNHYTNFQPLCSKINRDIKKDKIYAE